jgi:dolichyl-phosphate beta-glucosyltransferase
MRTQIVVPCYNEERRFRATAFDDYLAAHDDVGFVLVNDGSVDGTLGILLELQRRWSDRIQVIDQQPNQGKAEAVRAGMIHAAHAGADYIGYFDADLATPLAAIEEFVAILDRTARIDIVLGARVALLGRDIRRRSIRHYLGRVFATAASLVLAVPVYDTQCGAKLLRARTALSAGLFDRPFGSRWIFDVELIARYLTGSGSQEGLYEQPLREWTDVGESTVKARDFLRAGGEMAAIYREYQLHRDVDALLAILTAPFVRYAGAGVVGTAAHYGVLVASVELIGLSPTVATALGAISGAAINYVLNYHLTFASKAPHRRVLPRFLAVAALSTAVSAGGMWYAVHAMHIPYLAAQIFCTGLVLVLGFAFNRLWTFGSAGSASKSDRVIGKGGRAAGDDSAASLAAALQPAGNPPKWRVSRRRQGRAA